jgi:hypothetical protein
LKALSLLIVAEGVVARDNETHGVLEIFHNHARLEMTLAHIHRRNPSPGDDHWIGQHTPISGRSGSARPLADIRCEGLQSFVSTPGIDLPILLVDGTVAKSKVVSSSACEIVIELENGHRRRMTPIVAQHTEPSEFSGSEWIMHEHA